MRPIFVPLATEPFRKFQCGSKSVEIRRAKSTVAAQVRKADEGAHVVLSRGYGMRERLNGTLGPRWESPTLAELPPEVIQRADLSPNPLRFFDPMAPVLAFTIRDLCKSEEVGCLG